MDLRQYVNKYFNKYFNKMLQISVKEEKNYT